jgi:hypothetical protein
MSRPAITIRRPGLVPALTSLIPTAVFLLFDGWLGLVPAMIAASALTVVLIVVRRIAGRRIGILLPLTLSYVVVKAVAGVLTQSHAVYFGAGVALSALVALAVGATAFTRRPVAAYLIPHVTPYRRLTPDHPVYRKVAAHVTIVWALVELGIAGWEGLAPDCGVGIRVRDHAGDRALDGDGRADLRPDLLRSFPPRPA